MIQPYYQHDGITIYHGDCRDIIDQWEGLRTHSFDLLLTDPPYGLHIGSSPRLNEKRSPMAWDSPVDTQTLHGYINACRKAIIWGGNYYSLPPSAAWFVWDKAQPEEFSFSMVEHAWTNLKGTSKIFRKSVASYRGGEHHTEKPEELMIWCINRAGGQTIIDPFVGSGTTLVAAKRLGKFATGIEREERYCEIAAKRLSQGVLSEMFT